MSRAAGSERFDGTRPNLISSLNQFTYFPSFFLGTLLAPQNELAVLEFIHALVETMDKYFESVCELDVRRLGFCACVCMCSMTSEKHSQTSVQKYSSTIGCYSVPYPDNVQPRESAFYPRRDGSKRAHIRDEQTECAEGQARGRFVVRGVHSTRKCFCPRRDEKVPLFRAPNVHSPTNAPTYLITSLFL